MKHTYSAVRNSPEPEADPYIDEAMAMVYVGDVYSLVAQEAAPTETKTMPAPIKTRKRNEPQDDNDALWPFIR